MAVTGKAGTPQSVGNQRDARGVWPVFFAGEIPAKERLDAECRQEGRFDQRTLQAHGVLLGEIAIRPAGDK